MARAPKANEDTEEKQEGTAPEGTAAAPDTENKGTATATDPVIDELRAENAQLRADLEAIGEKLRLAALDAAEKEAAPNPLQAEVAAGIARIAELQGEISDLEAAAEDQGSDTSDHDGRERMARGFLLGVVMAMPENYRLNGLGAKLDEIEAFIGQFEGEDRYIAVELIKAIAVARPNDVPNGRYMNDVLRAFAVLDGVNEASIDAVKNRDEQTAAYNRLASVVGASPVPAGFVGEKHGGQRQPEQILDGDDEQNAAANRLQNAAG